MAGFQSKQETIISAGIDIGTSTTKIIISRFSLMNTAGSTHVPRIEIVDKDILYRSPIFRTPLKDTLTIDTAGVEAIIRSEYEAAGVQSADIETGAVIITGETATKQNAREMVHHLSGEAGDFLVATAGPDLEGIIAAKGSGAYAYSVQTGKVTANIDIGGGTANIAVFKREKLLGTCTMHIGGRLIEFSEGAVQSISAPVRALLHQQGWTLKTGDAAAHPDIENVTSFMAESLARILAKKASPADAPLLLGHEPNWDGVVEVIMFSGGISECMYAQEAPAVTDISYSDIGIKLADALQENKALTDWAWIEPDETVRATVLGAGTQTTEISGATIQVASGELPVKNVPVYKFSFKEGLEEGYSRFEQSVKEAIDIYDSFQEGQNFVLYVADLPYMGFKDIQRLAQEITSVMELRHDPDQPMILVVQTDHAKVLGQTLHAMAARQSIICIDQINVDHGDYMDIGRALQSEVVPVVVKTLTFHSS
ncbi:ethanolamine ammonia-lyase reactivating factor EutA [Domibacillus enclensis]|uniref:Ethanolamine utilization protein n=1 Tax=Domibacillus enclensis TaxID=1017273 RepID=A0A1N6ZFP9_9BACI|nr:ethanolamine ammonia-lyase reactivating factor EutA [Domibacillus enclensis]OXS76691.1 ethanolamine utilization protein [Domibacillus enclensis]SIR25645.1 ethanolamine utilization protein EutA [Domibacillus enclensis]